MRRKRIGFFHGDNETDDEKDGEDPFLKFLTVNKDQVKKFIEASYDSSGSTEQKEFKTSAELIYMLVETIDVSIKVVNEVMNELEYEMKFIDQIPNWILYSKDMLDDE